MPTQEKLIRRRQSLPGFGEYPQNVSQAGKIHGASCRHFYAIRKSYEEQGLEGLKEKTRRKLWVKNRVAPECGRVGIEYGLRVPRLWSGPNVE